MEESRGRSAVKQNDRKPIMNSHRLLLVEDDQAFAERMRRNLEMAGHQVSHVPSAEAALAYLSAHAVDLVVADVGLPGMSGVELLHRVRQGREPHIDATVPFVILTSVQSVDLAVEAMKGGAADFITKEASRQEILVRLSKVLEQSAVREENALLKERIDRTSWEIRRRCGDLRRKLMRSAAARSMC
jgi:DNA-binding response OmpR family regulator